MLNLPSEIRDLCEKPRIYYYRQRLIDALPWVEFIYYVNSKGAYFNGEEIKTRTELYRIPTWMPQLSVLEPGIDGPYICKEQVEQESPAYNLLILGNPVKAAEILLRRIKKQNRVVFQKYFSPDFIGCLPYILEHTFIGKFRNGFITGIHFSTSEVKLAKLVSRENNKIPYYHIRKQIYNTDSFLIKKAPSTFWPYEWQIEDFVIECAYAWCNRQSVKSNENIYEGTTTEGIVTVFCMSKSGKIKTVYPKAG